MTYYLLKLFLSAGVIVAVTEIAKRNNSAASIIHSLPLTSLLAFIWLYVETKDSALIGDTPSAPFGSSFPRCRCSS